MKDPIHQLSGIFIILLQCIAALLCVLFLLLGLLAFNGLDFVNLILKIIDEPYRIHSDQVWFAGFLFMGKAFLSLIAFIVFTYLKKVINKEMTSGPPFHKLP
ncbi:hypothetical protein QWY93_06880 [Echinicola jeungdonensis]|uniref:Uncharacterized protein n=1 Tax=Echinicola jeungdonensis TaxID=709343 RepID=A0ABV5J248_9BACT|nr:hypothetical protein [Echinicola jeungdonensis]MDN3669046.1 hypothetical protein [Echinicola jeungdonensis]